jgi:hypothetical protein
MLTALGLVTEIGDFHRFECAAALARWLGLGLVPRITQMR